MHVLIEYTSYCSHDNRGDLSRLPRIDPGPCLTGVLGFHPRSLEARMGHRYST